MVGIPLDLLWFESLSIIMGENNNKKKIKKKKSRSRKHEDAERYKRDIWHPFNSWSLP